MITEAFADHLTLGEGMNGRLVLRNTLPLLNIGLHPYFMADRKFETLEEQVHGPIIEYREFDMNEEAVFERLRNIPRYSELSMSAYNQEIDIQIVQKSLATFPLASLLNVNPCGRDFNPLGILFKKNYVYHSMHPYGVQLTDWLYPT